MMIVIWRVLTPSAGLYLDRKAMYHALVTALFDNMLSDRGRFNQLAVFFREDEFMWDLTFLLQFVTSQAGRFRELPVPGWVEVRVCLVLEAYGHFNAQMDGWPSVLERIERAEVKSYSSPFNRCQTTTTEEQSPQRKPITLCHKSVYCRD
jgi:hypothetical protein